MIVWPINSEYIHFCIPTKCGSAMFFSLLIRYITGKLPAHFPEPWIGTDLRRNGFDYHKLLNHTANNTIFISRHPLSRFLSGYLDKANDIRTKFSFKGKWESTPEAFTNFIMKFVQKYPNIGNNFAKLHFLPLDYYFTCSNKFSEHYKLETMSEWYPYFIKKYNMLDAISDPRWEGGCWWRQTNSTCKKSLIETKTTNCLLTHNKHNKNACSLINTYYNNNTKLMIYNIFKKDFVRSNYTIDNIL